jgi:aryl sulfotransferase
MPELLRPAARELRSPTMNSRLWDDWKPRDDDIIVATYPKCGTTWTQRIVDLLVFQSAEPRQFLAASPWLDATFFAPHAVNLATIEAQTHRRYLKSHLPFDALPVYDGVRYIHTARDGRDACLSMHNHQLGMKPEIFANIAANAPKDRPPPRPTPQDPREYFLQWMDDAEAEGDTGNPNQPYCEFEQTYWDERRRPNLLMVHYADLKADLEGEMGRISDFLGIATPASLLSELAEAARFETMKSQGDVILPQLRNGFDRGADRFLDKGQNGRWKGVLTDADLARYDALARRKLSPSLHAWLHNGRLAAGDPRDLPD